MIKVAMALGKLLTILSGVLGLGLFIDIPVGIILQEFPPWWFWPSAFASITAICTVGILLAGTAESKMAPLRPPGSQ